MVPFAIAQIALDSYRRQLESLGLEPAKTRHDERRDQLQEIRQLIVRIGRRLARRPMEPLPRDAIAGSAGAAAR